jgi:hypothetical protein
MMRLVAHHLVVLRKIYCDDFRQVLHASFPEESE